MCKSISEGGQRCAAHTRGPAQALLNDLATRGDQGQDLAALDAYASTPEGQLALMETLSELKTSQQDTSLLTACLLGSVKRGEQIRVANLDTARILRGEAAFTPEEAERLRIEQHARTARAASEQRNSQAGRETKYGTPERRISQAEADELTQAFGSDFTTALANERAAFAYEHRNNPEMVERFDRAGKNAQNYLAVTPQRANEDRTNLLLADYLTRGAENAIIGGSRANSIDPRTIANAERVQQAVTRSLRQVTNRWDAHKNWA